MNTLQFISYYRLSGYTLTLRKDDTFYKDVTFENVMELYNFDCQLRPLILYLLGYVEISFRTHIAYYHTERFGPLGYLGYEGFEDKGYHDEFIDEFREIVSDEKRNTEAFIKHHLNNYDGQFPIWVAVELLSFGNISKLYNNSIFEIRQKIALDNYGIKEVYIQNWLHGLVILRNICAHRARLYNRPMPIRPKISNKDKKIGIRNDLVFIYLFLRNLLRMKAYGRISRLCLII